MRRLAQQLEAALASAVRERAAPRQHQHRLSPTEVAEMVAEYQAGALVHDLAQRWGVDPATVTAHIKAAGVRRAHGLTAEQIVRARQLYEQERWSLNRIGQEFGAAHNTVRSALRHAGVQMRDTHGRAR